MEIHHTINKPLSEVYFCVADMNRFAEVHPVIYKAEQTDSNNYIFFEKINMLFIPYRFSYPVRLISTSENTLVEMDSNVKKSVYLHLKFEFIKGETATVVKETIQITAPPIIKQIFALVLKSAHKKFFKNVERMPLSNFNGA